MKKKIKRTKKWGLVTNERSFVLTFLLSGKSKRIFNTIMKDNGNKTAEPLAPEFLSFMVNEFYKNGIPYEFHNLLSGEEFVFDGEQYT